MRLLKSRRTARSTRRRLGFEPLEYRRVLATFIVTDAADSLDDGTLRSAINEANLADGQDRIKFAHDVHAISLTLGELDITDDLVIHGPGAHHLTISGGGIGRVFSVEPDVDGNLPTATFKRLTIADGLATDAPGFESLVPPGTFAFGGGIYNQGGDVLLSQVNVVGNQAGDGTQAITAGGAIANEFGGTLTVRHSHFSDNVSFGILSGVGGAITSDVGPGVPAQPEVVVTHSSFVDNVAQNLTGPNDAFPLFSGFASGGAILSIAGSLEVSHSSFQGNQAIGRNGGSATGGAIYTGDPSPFADPSGPLPDATLDVRHSRFVGNEAIGGDAFAEGLAGTGRGGAIANTGGADVTVTRSWFAHNLARGGDGPGGGAEGGAIAVGVFAGFEDSLGSLSVNGTVFLGNRAQGGSESDGVGGAISVIGGSTATIAHSSILSNEASGGANGGDGQGGGLYNGVGSETQLTRSFVLGNRATGTGGDSRGGGIHNASGTADFDIDPFSYFFARFNEATDGDDDLFNVDLP